MKRVLVTGGCGFIGRSLVRTLLRQGVDVEVFDALTPVGRFGEPELRSLGVVVRPQPVEFVSARMLERFDLVYHLAAESHVDASLEAPLRTWTANAVGTAVVAFAAAAARVPMLYVSTDEVYGDARVYSDALGCNTFDEDRALLPSSPYSASKAAGEHAVVAAQRSFGLNAVIVRPTNAWGPGQYPEKLVPRACRLLRSGNPVPMHGGGGQVRQWVNVDELADGIAKAAGILPTAEVYEAVPVFNLGGPVRASVFDVVSSFHREALRLGATTIQTGTFETVDRPGQDLAYSVNSDLAREVFGWNPKRSILDPVEVEALLAAYPPDGTEAPPPAWEKRA
jgi:dTDP-glucose 4,6-dehydratase